jgi:hypothetical protein
MRGSKIDEIATDFISETFIRSRQVKVKSQHDRFPPDSLVTMKAMVGECVTSSIMIALALNVDAAEFD